MKITKKILNKTTEVTFSDITLALLTATITVLILVASLSYAFSPFDPEKDINTLTMRHGDFDISFFDGINNDYKCISAARDVFSNKVSFYYPQFIREILFFHMDFGFLLGLVAGADKIMWLLISAYVLKYGLLSAFCYLLLKRGINLGRMPSVVLSVAFSVSVLAFTCGLNTALLNTLVLIPLVLLLVLNYIKAGSRKDLAFVVAGFFVFSFQGVYSVVALPFLLLITLVVVIGSRSFVVKSYLRVLSAFISGSLLSLFITIPFALSSRFVFNIKHSFIEGKVKFTLFDSLYRLLDGNLSGGSFLNKMPAIGLGTFVVVLLILFFINQAIPFRFKITSGLLLLLLYISVAYDAFERFLVFEGSSYTFSYLRVAIMAFLILIMASVSLKNAAMLHKGEIYAAVFSVIIYLVLSNNSKSEIAHGTVSMYLSAFMAIISGCALLAVCFRKNGVAYFFLLLILGEVAFNAAFVLAPSSFTSSDLKVDSVFDNYNMDSENFIFESGKMEYLVLSEDLKETPVFIPPHERINNISKALYLNNVFKPVENYPVYVSGAAVLGDDMYEALPESPMMTVNIRINRTNLNSDVYLSCSYEGQANIRLLYGEQEDIITAQSPFLLKLDVNELSFIAAIDFTANRYGRFDLCAVEADVNEKDAFLNSVNEIRNNEINLSSNHSMLYDGTRTVITSVKYSPDLEVIYTRDNKILTAECFNFNGLLAFNVESGGFDHQQAKIISSKNDLIAGIVATVVVIISFIFVGIMYNKKAVLKKAESEIDKNSYVGDENLDKRED